MIFLRFVLLFLLYKYCRSIEIYGNRPRLVTYGGHLEIISAENANITLRTRGTGYINVNGQDLLQNLRLAHLGALSINELKTTKLDRFERDLNRLLLTIEGPNGLKYRLDNIGSGVSASSPSPINMPLINRRIGILRRRINKVEVDLQSLTDLLNRDECSSNPCKNGGRCQDLLNNFLCWCPNNWEGLQCDIDVNECSRFIGTDLGCQNGATCVNKPGSYECICPPGWYGLHCTSKTNDCNSASAQELCGHGICVSQRNTHGYACICDPGWKTDGVHPSCIVDVDECSSDRPHCSVSPPVKCVNVPGSYICGPCPAGYTGNGYHCSDIDECAERNGGCSSLPFVQCINTIGSYYCGPCPPGYQGNGKVCVQISGGACSINNGGCSPIAACVAKPEINPMFVQCICPNNYVGDGVGPNGCTLNKNIPINSSDGACANAPCGENGFCVVDGNSYRCVCINHYVGRNCELLDRCSLDNPCENGGTCKNTVAGTKCDCPPQYQGSKCQFQKRVCGGFISAENGSIHYPPLNSSGYYDHKMDCAWTIQTTSNKILNITFNKFDLEYSPTCNYDWLQIHDGKNSAARLINRYCGTKLPEGGNIVSTHNTVYLWFHSDTGTAKEGFSLSWKSEKPLCTQVINLAKTKYGTLNSPGSPGNYPPNRDCHWLVLASVDKRIQFHFYTMMLGDNPDCNADYLEIFAGYSKNGPLLAKYCKTSHPEPLITPGAEAYIHFHSDATGSNLGFQITFSEIEGIPGCGGVYTKERGEISSPLQDGKYPSNYDCEYLIKFVNGSRVKLTFISMDLEESEVCNFDYIEIREGSARDPKDKDFIGKYCGTTLPPTWISSSNEVYIKFHSDPTHTSSGFRIGYSSVCGKVYTKSADIITSPNYPKDYSTFFSCEYIISTAQSTAVKIQFLEFNVGYENSTCDKLFLEIHDGPDSKAPLINKYCGTTANVPFTITSTHNSLYMYYQSYLKVPIAKKFLINYTSIDLGCGGILKDKIGVIQSPTDVEHYPVNTVCRWLLSAPPGYVIQLTWISFELEKSFNCTADYVAVYDATVIPGVTNPLGKYCGNVKPPFIVSSSNLLTVEFKSDMSKSAEGFVVNYVMKDESHVCGRPYFSSVGVVTSPNYPNGYPKSKNCVWIINVPAGQQILLNITDFEIETHLNCRFDFLEIRNGGYETSPLIGKFCGTNIPRLIPSQTNQLYLHFQSDASRSAKGFNITWDGTTTGCGGTLYSWTGHITSPNYPQSYGRNAECYWKIVTSAGSVIHVIFFDLDLEHSANCRLDYIEIHNGLKLTNNPIGRYCSNNNQAPIIKSTTNKLFLKFRSDISHEGRGFNLKYSAVCNNQLTGHQGVIESPNYPDKYPFAQNCQWEINVPIGNKINVTFSHFDLESPRHNSGECKFDYVEIRESGLDDESDATVLGRFCGNDIPDPISSAENKVIVIFKSDNMVVGNGFRLEWVINGCGGLLSKPNGEFTSPHYPDYYPTNTECEWLIQIPNYDRSIELTIEDLDIERLYGCDFDYLDIYGGPDDTTPRLNRLCSSTKEKVVITSSGSSMFIRFKSDNSFRGKGFRATYKTIPIKCGGKVTANTGVILSRNYPKNYEHNDNCYWLIEMPPTYLIQLNFEDFDLEMTKTCLQDFVKIFDGNSTEAPMLLHHCGNTLPNPISYTSSGNTMLIYMRTDSLLTAKGFKANYTIACGAHIITDTFGILNYHEHMEILDNCSWTIEANRPGGGHVSLTITKLALEDSFMDDDNILIIYNGLNDKSPQIGNYTGHKIPPTIVSDGHALHISLVASGKFDFVATYSALTETCGGNLTSKEGEFASLGYPNNYLSNIDCVWTILPSLGNRAYLSFNFISIEKSEHCNNDFIEIREQSATGKLLDVICGKESEGNRSYTAPSLWIRFKTNEEGIDKGFLAYYHLEFGHDNITGTRGEIQSPFYPKHFQEDDTIQWTITVERGNVIMITFTEFEFNGYEFGETECSGTSFKVYDGTDTSADPILESCGMTLPKPTFTKSNVAALVFESQSHWKGSLFALKWEMVNQRNLPTNSLNNCGSDTIVDLDTITNFTLTSPGYPYGYGKKLYCTWKFTTSQYNHSVILFQDMNLEPSPRCAFDSVAVYSLSSKSSGNENPIGKYCLPSATTEPPLHGGNLMIVGFKTNAFFNRTGFKALLYSSCGGDITDPNGVIEITEDYYFAQKLKPGLYSMECQWNITVRPGRQIKFKFDYLKTNGTTFTTNCNNYVMIKDGQLNDSPFLGIGKYCTSEKISQEIPVTTGNLATVKYKIGLKRHFMSFRLRFKQISQTCGGTIVLSKWFNSTNITSPNYPEIPNPHTECEWIIKAPPGESLLVTFMERFDVVFSKNCKMSGIELHDGGSVYAPLLLQHCRSSLPNSLTTIGNLLYVRYYTDVPEPGNGFKAEISLAKCGGTIRFTKETILTSPNYPIVGSLTRGLNCEWRIIGPTHQGLEVRFNDLNLPRSFNCSTVAHIKILEKEIETYHLGVFCGSTNKSTIVQSYSNEISIIFDSLDKSWNYFKGFSLTIVTRVIPGCGKRLQGPEGVFTAPGYPKLRMRHEVCKWEITAPAGRRIKVDVEAFDINNSSKRAIEGSEGLAFFNSENYDSTIYQNKAVNQNITVRSASNYIFVYYWAFSKEPSRGFRARWSSNEPSICRGNLNDVQGTIQNPSKDSENLTTYVCVWERNSLNTQSETLAITLENAVFPPKESRQCRYANTNIQIFKEKGIKKEPIADFCETIKEPVTIRTPYKYTKIWALQDKKAAWANYTVSYRVYNCGGEYSNPLIVILRGETQIPLDKRECAWVLKFAEGSQVKVTFSEMNLDASCNNEYITVKNGEHPSSPTIHKYCGKQIPQPIISQSNRLWIDFHSNIKNTSRSNPGFTFTAESIANGCGGTYHANSMIIKSPNYPKNYPSNAECVWEVRVDDGYHIGLYSIDNFQLEQSLNCTNDSVEVLDYIDGSWKLLGRACGRNFPTFNSTGTRMIIRFKSNDNINGIGFKLQWKVNCGGTFYATNRERVIVSPGYPNFYSNSLNCQYVIVATDQKINLQFSDFDLEKGRMRCEFDNITIIKYHSRRSIFRLSPYGQAQFTYCGKDMPPALTSNDRVEVVFRTDRWVARKGFAFKFSTDNCGSNIKEPTVIVSPKEKYSVNRYARQSNCIWNITAPDDKIISLRFQKFEVEFSTVCRFDYVAIYEGTEINATRMVKKLCGAMPSSYMYNVQSTGNNMLVQFHSDSTNHLGGFEIDVSFTFGPNSGCGGVKEFNEFHSSENFKLANGLKDKNGLYLPFLNCQWLLKAPRGYVFKIKFLSFHLATCSPTKAVEQISTNVTQMPNNNCNCDYFQINDGPGAVSDLIMKHCGHSNPEMILSSTNFLWINFVSDGSTERSSGFEASISIEKSICGDVFLNVTEQKQTLTSPNFPAKYPPNVRCIWYLKSSIQYGRIDVHFESLELQEPNEDGFCLKDKVEINDLYSDTPYIAEGTGSKIFNGLKPPQMLNSFWYRSKYPTAKYTLCGGGKPLDYYSGTNQIQIAFISDASVEKKGFKITYQNIGCNRNFTEEQGRINIQKMQQSNCRITITTSQDRTISLYFLTFFMFDVTQNCSKAGVTIRDGLNGNSKVLLRACGLRIPSPIHSTGNTLSMDIWSLNSRRLEMLDATYTTTDQGSGCGGILYNYAGKFASRNFPFVYKNDSVCSWDVSTPVGTQIFLQFNDINLGTQATCETDFLEIYVVNPFTGFKSRFGRYCGTGTPKQLTFDTNAIIVKYTTSKNNVGTGFVISFYGKKVDVGFKMPTQ